MNSTTYQATEDESCLVLGRKSFERNEETSYSNYDYAVINTLINKQSQPPKFINCCSLSADCESEVWRTETRTQPLTRTERESMNWEREIKFTTWEVQEL